MEPGYEARSAVAPILRSLSTVLRDVNQSNRFNRICCGRSKENRGVLGRVQPTNLSPLPDRSRQRRAEKALLPFLSLSTPRQRQLEKTPRLWARARSDVTSRKEVGWQCRLRDIFRPEGAGHLSGDMLRGGHAPLRPSPNSGRLVAQRSWSCLDVGAAQGPKAMLWCRRGTDSHLLRRVAKATFSANPEVSNSGIQMRRTFRRHWGIL
jgi:hypothetical protein